jgi:hypothetical protein
MGERAMQIIQEIKIERLLLALGITLLIADTVPHPNLSAGLVEYTLYRVQAGLIQESSTAGAIAGLNR